MPNFAASSRSRPRAVASWPCPARRGVSRWAWARSSRTRADVPVPARPGTGRRLRRPAAPSRASCGGRARPRAPRPARGALPGDQQAAGSQQRGCVLDQRRERSRRHARARRRSARALARAPIPRPARSTTARFAGRARSSARSMKSHLRPRRLEQVDRGIRAARSPSGKPGKPGAAADVGDRSRRRPQAPSTARPRGCRRHGRRRACAGIRDGRWVRRGSPRQQLEQALEPVARRPRQCPASPRPRARSSAQAFHETRRAAS